MAEPTAVECACSSAAEQSTQLGARRANPLCVGHSTLLEGAGDFHPMASNEEEHIDAKVGSKRRRSNLLAVGERSAATTGRDRHVADNPMEGAAIHFRLCRRLLLS